MGKKLLVEGNINELAKYLNMDEIKVFSIFDYDSRKSIERIEKELKRKKEDKNIEKPAVVPKEVNNI